MAKAYKQKVTLIHLKLTEQEAIYLKELTQNYMIPAGPNNPEQEPIQETVLRESIFSALQGLQDEG